MRFEYRVTNNLAGLADRLERGEPLVRQKVIEDIAADWAATVRVDEGTYKNSITTADDGPTRSVAYSDVEHSIYNELGTVRMAGDGAAAKAAERHRDAYYEAMGELLR